MGYQTDLYGTLKLNRQLTVDEKNFLEKLATTRRMARNIEGYGVEGEFYVDDEAHGMGLGDPTVIEHNTPPKTQPGLWLQWVPTEDGMGIEWDGNEKFYNYVEWLQYLIDSVFPYIVKEGDEPLVLNGEIEWEGEESGDLGRIVVKDNIIDVKHGRVVYGKY